MGLKRKEKEEYETVFLGDVETGNYATVLGSPTYNMTVKSFKKGNKYELPTDKASEDFVTQYIHSGTSIASLLRTGFLTAHDLAMLDNTAGAVSKLKEVGGEQGLETLLTLATPRKEAMKRRLLKRYDDIKNVPGDSMSKSGELQPGVQTYLWALDHAAVLRARTRMRRRKLVHRREWDLRYESLLRRGGQPFRGKRMAVDTFDKTEEETPIPGRPYFEQGHICTYWYHPTLKHWVRMVGPAMAATNKRAAILTNRISDPSAEDTDQIPINDSYLLTAIPDKYTTLTPSEFKRLFNCMDKQGLPTLRLHQAWMEYKYPTPINPGACQGLCRFSDGWVLPEGSDGLPTHIQLSFSKKGDYCSTPVLCGACNIQLCKKCYTLLLKHHTAKGASLAQMMRIYSRYRMYRIGHPKATYAEFLNTLPPKANLETVDEAPDLSFDWMFPDDPGAESNPNHSLIITRALKLLEYRRRSLVPLGIPKGVGIPLRWGPRGPAPHVSTPGKPGGKIIQQASCMPPPASYVPPQRKPGRQKKPSGKIIQQASCIPPPVSYVPPQKEPSSPLLPEKTPSEPYDID